MLPQLFWIGDIKPLRLAIMARPRSEDWLHDEISGWQQAGITTVVSLLEIQEVRELGLKDEPSLCAGCEIDFLSCPIVDRGTPKSASATAVLAEDLAARLHRGAGVGIHCRAGIGRSGLLAACVLVKLGVPFADVFPMLSKARKMPVPDTPAQVDWVRKFSLQKQDKL